MEKSYKPIKDFTELLAWQAGHALVILIYQQIKNYSKEEQFGLVSQMRKSASSVTSNIAEGFSRKTAKDKSHLSFMAKGSILPNFKTSFTSLKMLAV